MTSKKARTEHLHVLVTKSFKDKLDKYVVENDTTISELIRQELAKIINKSKE